MGYLLQSDRGRYNRLISYFLCRQVLTKFKEEIIWLYKLIEQEFKHSGKAVR